MRAMRIMEILPAESEATEKLILFFNDLFDILNKRNYTPTGIIFHPHYHLKKINTVLI